MKKLRGDAGPDVLAELAEAYGVTEVDVPMDLSADDLQSGAAMAVAFAALTPQFMYR